MALNYIFIGFFVIAFVVAILRVIGYLLRDHLEILGLQFTDADLNIFETIVDSTFSMAETSIEICIYLIGVMTLWLGIMRIGEKGGIVAVMARWVGPFFNKLFPEVPADHPANGAIIMNFAANMLGLDNAATPFGLKAMEQLQELNPKKDTASNSQIMFLVLNTSGLTLLPISVIGLRAANGAGNPSDVFIPILLATWFATMGGLIFTSIKHKINIFQASIIKVIGIMAVLVAAIVYGFTKLTPEESEIVSSIVANGILLSIIVGFIVLAARKKVNIYESFIDGAKEGFQIAIKIIPYLVGMLVAIGVFRASGALDLVIGSFKHVVLFIGMDTAFVDALPTAFMKPLSGSGARAAMVEVFVNKDLGVDSFAGVLASIFQGSTETTFYTLAVYYGAVGVQKTRHTVTAGLFADFCGIVAAIWIGYIMFSHLL